MSCGFFYISQKNDLCVMPRKLHCMLLTELNFYKSLSRLFCLCEWLCFKKWWGSIVGLCSFAVTLKVLSCLYSELDICHLLHGSLRCLILIDVSQGSSIFSF